MAIKQAKYKIINADNSVDIIHFQTNADLIVDGSNKQVPTKSQIDKWNSVSGGGTSIYVSDTAPSSFKALDLFFKFV